MLCLVGTVVMGVGHFFAARFGQCRFSLLWDCLIIFPKNSKFFNFFPLDEKNVKNTRV